MRHLKSLILLLISGGITGLFLLLPDTSLAACTWDHCTDPRYTLCCNNGIGIDACAPPLTACSTFTNCGVNNYFCASGYKVQCSPLACVTPIPTPTPTPLPTPLPTPTPITKYVNFGITGYSISGDFFLDNNPNGKKDPGEPSYSNGSIHIRGSGAYSFLERIPYLFANLSSGEHIVSFRLLNSPANYRITHPPFNNNFCTLPNYPNCSNVSVGSSCYYPAASEARCTFGDTGGNCTTAGAKCSGAITNLNVAVSTSYPAWIQSKGTDIRWDSSSPSYTGIPPSKDYEVSLKGSGGMPGIIFTGKSNPFPANQKISSTNWRVGSFSYPDLFTRSHSMIPTSYNFLLNTVEGSGIEKKDIKALCKDGWEDPALCVITPGLSNGVYFVDLGGADTLTLNSSDYYNPFINPEPIYRFQSNKNYVILVHGNIKFNTAIQLKTGSTVIFSASGNITIDKSIGKNPPSQCNPSDDSVNPGCALEGLYSADKNFIVESRAQCVLDEDGRYLPDLQLNIAGTVIANAARRGGTFTNNRSLCSSNEYYPSVSFVENPELMMNYPSMVKRIPRIWQEVAP